MTVQVNSSKYALRGGTAKQSKWSMQVFRSINEDGCDFLKEGNLKSVKGRLVDDGLHRSVTTTGQFTVKIIM